MSEQASQPKNLPPKEISKAIEYSSTLEEDQSIHEPQIAQVNDIEAYLVDVQAACQTMLNNPHLKHLIRFDAAEICLLNEKTGLLKSLIRLPEENGVHHQAYERAYNPEEGYTGWIAANKSPLYINNTHEYTEVAPKIGREQFPYQSYIGVPLEIQGKLLGTFEVATHLPNMYQQEDITILQTIASQAAIIIENSRLFSLTNRQLHIRVDELDGLQRVSHELNSTLDLEKILDTVLEEARRVTLADIANVYFVDASTENLVAYNERGWHNPLHLKPGASSPAISAKNGIVGQVLQSGQSILTSNELVSNDDVTPSSRGLSKVAVPIRYEGQPVGAINLESRRSNFFDNNQLRYLESLANHAAVAIRNAEAYQQQKREREQASRQADQFFRLSEISNAFRTNRPLAVVLEDIAFAISEAVGYDMVLISLVRGKPPMLYHEVGAGIPVAELNSLRQPEQATALENLKAVLLEEFRLGNAYFIPSDRRNVWQNKLNIPYLEKSHALSRYQPQTEPPILMGVSAVDEAWQTGDLLLLPLQSTNDDLIGLLTIENPITNQRPNLASIKTLETFANHAASAVENAQLFESEQQRRQLADTLHGVAELISSHLQFDEVLQLVLQELKKVVEYDKSTVELLEESQLVIIGGQGWEEYSRQMIGLSFSMEGHNPSRKVLETQEPLIVKDARAEYPAIFSSPPYDRVRSWLGAPLTYGTNILGLMSISSSAVDFFSAEDVEVVVAFANQVAVALQNARLFDEARQQVRQLAALTEVAQSLNQALELDQVLDLVLDAVFDLIGQNKGSIWLVDNDTDTVKIANTKNIPEFLVREFNRSNTPVNFEPFASVIRSGEVLIVEGDKQEDKIADYGLPFPEDVTYVPLKTEEGVTGILALEAVIRNKTTLELVTTLANLAAVAIDSARLLEDTRLRAAEMQHLYRLGVEISGMLEVRQVMRSVLSSTLTLMEGQIGVIVFWDEQANQYIFEGTAASAELMNRLGLSQTELLQFESPQQSQVSLWAGLTKQITNTGQPILSNLAVQKSIRNSETVRQSATVSDITQSEREALRLGLNAILGVPILVQNQIAGAIFVGTALPDSFNDRDIQTLSFVANQAVVAIRNAQLVQRLNLLTEGLEQRVNQRTEELAKTLQDLTEERDRIGVLYELANQLSSSFDLQQVLHSALNLINGAIGISQGTILLLDPETDQLVNKVSIGRDKPLPLEGLPTRYKIGYGLAGRVMQTRRPRLVSDLLQDPDWVPGDLKVERRSALAVPLSTGHDVLGALLLFHPDPNYFTDEHLKLVSAAGTQIATAINNANLYISNTEQAERLKIMYQQQAAEAAKNEAILDGIADGVLVLDAKRNIVLINPMAADILDIDATQLEYQFFDKILDYVADSPESDLVQLFYNQLAESLTTVEQQEKSVEFRISAGAQVVTVTLTPVALSEKAPPSTIAVLRDVSKEAEIDRLKNEFISSVSHELRTPMTSIKGYTDLLLSGNAKIGELNPTQHRFIKIIQSNTNRLTELVNDILEISRIETGRIKLKLESIDAAEVIREVAVSFEGQMVQKSLSLVLDLPEHLPKIYADRARLTQILVNLIGNAWQYTPESGNIIVSAQVVDQCLQIDVKDNGIGIVEKDIKFLFDRFFRSERTEVQVVDGTGLGLSITRSFVEILGGEIWVDSKLDVGSTFSFTIPLAAEAQTKA